MTDQPALYTGISGGRVLDIGTGRGGFVEELIAELKDYDEIIGIDVDGSLGEAFAQRFASHPRVRFEVMDAMSMSFDDGTFDTVSIAGSLHHLADPQSGLREMTRVLRRGGRFVAVEMYRDGQTETQQTHVMLHHWWASVDRLHEVVHRETYTRDDIVDMIASLNLSGLEMRDDVDLHQDSKDPDQLAQLEAGVDNAVGRAQGHPDLLAEGEELRARLHRVGFHFATVLVAVGEKR